MSKKNWHGSTRAARLPKNWPAIRRYIMQRDAYTCQIRGNHCQIAATQVDHIEPGDNHDQSNLQAVCAPCHQQKTINERKRAPKQRNQRHHPGIKQKPQQVAQYPHRTPNNTQNHTREPKATATHDTPQRITRHDTQQPQHHTEQQHTQ